MSTIFLVLIVYDVVRFVLAHRLLSFRQIYGDEVNYFSRLGKTDRKRWLVQEMYMRETFGVKQIDDHAFEKILNTKSIHSNVSVDPPNFNILFNSTYQKKLGFTPAHL